MLSIIRSWKLLLKVEGLMGSQLTHVQLSCKCIAALFLLLDPTLNTVRLQGMLGLGGIKVEI